MTPARTGSAGWVTGPASARSRPSSISALTRDRERCAERVGEEAIDPLAGMRRGGGDADRSGGFAVGWHVGMG